MPRKLRELMAELVRLGFADRSGKGSHRNYVHENGMRITLSGKPGDDAKSYQEQALTKARPLAQEKK